MSLCDVGSVSSFAQTVIKVMTHLTVACSLTSRKYVRSPPPVPSYRRQVWSVKAQSLFATASISRMGEHWMKRCNLFIWLKKKKSLPKMLKHKEILLNRFENGYFSSVRKSIKHVKTCPWAPGNFRIPEQAFTVCPHFLTGPLEGWRIRTWLWSHGDASLRLTRCLSALLAVFWH